MASWLDIYAGGVERQGLHRAWPPSSTFDSLPTSKVRDTRCTTKRAPWLDPISWRATKGRVRYPCRPRTGMRTEGRRVALNNAVARQTDVACSGHRATNALASVARDSPALSASPRPRVVLSPWTACPSPETAHPGSPVGPLGQAPPSSAECAPHDWGP